MNFEEKTLVIAFTDLARYSKLSARLSNGDVFMLISELSEMIGEAVDEAGGNFIKQMGDESMITFDESQVAGGVESLRSLKATVDRWLQSRGLDSEMLIRVNIGKVAVGKIGPPGKKRMDIVGRAVNDTAMLKKGSFVLAPTLEKILAS